MTTAYYITYISNQISNRINNLLIIAWSLINNIAEYRYQNDITITFLNILLLTILSIYLLRRIVLSYRKPIIYQGLLERLLETTMVIKDNQKLIIDEIIEINKIVKKIKVSPEITPKSLFEIQKPQKKPQKKPLKRRRYNRASKLRAQYKILYGQEINTE